MTIGTPRISLYHDLMPDPVLKLPHYICKHCDAFVLINPLRTRTRHECQACKGFVCDECRPKCPKAEKK